VPGAKECNQLRDFIIGERVLEAGHLLTAIFNLIGNLLGLHGLAHVSERRTLLGSLTGCPMTVGASLVPEKDGSGLFRFFGSRSEGGVNGKVKREDDDQGWKQARAPQFECNHVNHFLIGFPASSHPQVGFTLFRAVTVRGRSHEKVAFIY